MPISSVEYIEKQNEFQDKYPIFTKAIIKRAAKDFEKGWGMEWDIRLNTFVGEEIEIFGYSNFYGVMTRECHFVPYFVLQPIEKTVEKREIYPAVIAIDADGTCFTHEYPEIGRDIGAVKVLKELVDAGHKLIVNTMRHNPEDYEQKRNTLNEFIQWLYDNKIEFLDVQKNPNQNSWTTSTKVWADYIIDDTAVGCPLKYDKNISDSPFVDWVKMRELLVNLGLLN